MRVAMNDDSHYRERRDIRTYKPISDKLRWR